jgi:7,8-dihydropterin-6-yl-methyl-4-(beta-D-ribofuranosyl)aminobenzene 5'-phosphate synthase
VAAESKITILYDAFDADAAMKEGWGFSTLIEVAGKRILFETNNDSDVFATNVKAGIDLGNLDFVVPSHRHSVAPPLLSVNPRVKIYAPREGFDIYGSSLPSNFYRKDETLPPQMRYYDGKPLGKGLESSRLSSAPQSNAGAAL